MLPPLYACEFCSEEISPADKKTWILVTGWVQTGKTSAPKYASAPHGWACNQCMMEKKYGTVKNTSMF